jgi:hypothetical protein
MFKVILTLVLYCQLLLSGKSFSFTSRRHYGPVASLVSKNPYFATILSASNRPVNKSTKKKEDIDLSYIESRDMTREEMYELNKANERVMNNELVGMTGVSLLFSLPILYLCWVAYFSE